MKNFQSQPRSGFGFGSPHIGRRPARSSGPHAAPAAPVARHPPRSPVTVTAHPRAPGRRHLVCRTRSPVTGHRQLLLPTVKVYLSVGVGVRQHAGHLADARWGDRSGLHRGRAVAPTNAGTPRIGTRKRPRRHGGSSAGGEEGGEGGLERTAPAGNCLTVETVCPFR